MAENGGLSDCSRCRSAGSVWMGRCQICEWEAEGRPLRVPPERDDEGTLTTANG